MSKHLIVALSVIMLMACSSQPGGGGCWPADAGLDAEGGADAGEICAY